MKASNKILHEKQYAERILEITGDTMFFVYKDGTCLDFKPNRPDFYIKEEEVVGKNIFSYFPLETARKMHISRHYGAQCSKAETGKENK